MITALEGGEGSASRPGRSLPPGKDLVPIVQEAGWVPGSGQVRKISPPPGFDPRTIQPVKCTLVQALRLCTDRTAHRGSRGIALLFLDHGTRRGEGSASRTGRSLPPGKDLVPIVQEAGWAPGLVRTGAQNLASTGIRFPDHPARKGHPCTGTEALYRPYGP